MKSQTKLLKVREKTKNNAKFMKNVATRSLNLA